MPRKPHVALSAGELEQVSSLVTEKARAAFLRRNPSICRPVVIRQLNDEIRKHLRADTRRCLRLADAAILIGRRLGNREELAHAIRSKANVLYVLGENQASLDRHAEALDIFRGLGNAEQEARTLNASIQPLILLGQYDRAFEAAEAARELFRRTGDQRRLGYVEINVGNIYHRQDRFDGALACYQRAYEILLPFRDSEALTLTFYNMAVCLITLNNFPRALAAYERARQMCLRHGMPLLVTQADYNIAYLYFLRGEYTRAIELLRATREACAKNGDTYVLALCYLDLAEIYLELNLGAEAIEMAAEGQARFQKLGMGYERAKCLAFEAMGHGQLGRAVRAIELFGHAREIFVREKNRIWPSLLELYQALVFFNEGRLFEARRFCTQAAAFFDSSVLTGKAALCHLLLGRLALREGSSAVAARECQRALDAAARLETPALLYQAQFLRGEILVAGGDGDAAYQSFQKARAAMETLRGSLRAEELKIAFMKNRLEVYENLIEICLARNHSPAALRESFHYLELAKSRSLAELLTHPGYALSATSESGQSELVRKIRDMREDLNWYYRRIEREQLASETPAPGKIRELQRQALVRENELLRALRELPSPVAPGQRAAGMVAEPAASLETIQGALPPDAALLEYFSLKDHIHVALVTREDISILPLTPASRAANLVRLLRFQISKFRLGAGYVRLFEKTLREAARAHLASLHAELVAPFREHLRARHLVIVPHGVLHYLPFHALWDGAAYLLDSFTISYAPSASVFALCQGKSTNAAGPPLVLGVPDDRAPLIRNEVESVAGILPGAQLVLGAEPCEKALRERGAFSRLIHVATHGHFRQDNPMFSGIRLGRAYLNLYDFYQLKTGAELVSLSGCGTGLNVIAAGDELLGLARGLLHAGASSLLLTLWDVHDRSTTEFMTSFYRRLQQGDSKPVAVQAAMQALREEFPHPYYWAPFLLIGKI